MPQRNELPPAARGRPGDVGKRDRNRGERNRVEAEQESGGEADYQGGKVRLLRDCLELLCVQKSILVGSSPDGAAQVGRRGHGLED